MTGLFERTTSLHTGGVAGRWRRGLAEGQEREEGVPGGGAASDYSDGGGPREQRGSGGDHRGDGRVAVGEDTVATQRGGPEAVSRGQRTPDLCDGGTSVAPLLFIACVISRAKAHALEIGAPFGPWRHARRPDRLYMGQRGQCRCRTRKGSRGRGRR